MTFLIVLAVLCLAIHLVIGTAYFKGGYWPWSKR